MHKVLILDGNQRSALATTRSLGRRGLSVSVAEANRQSLAGRSKYCKQHIELPSPDRQADEFVNGLAHVISEHQFSVLLPMTDVSTSIVLQNRQRLGDIALPCPTYNAYDDVSNKYNLFKKAAALGIPIPSTLFIETIEQFELEKPNITYPTIIKPAYSKVYADGQWLSTSVSYADSREELHKLIEIQPWLRLRPFMLQEVISGQGQGIFAIYEHGRPVCFFCHKRIREKPPSGGVSVVCESAPVDANMQKIAESILGKIKWHGVAMVEFKVALDGTPYLIEINGRFWGSLQLPVDAGLDFPYLTYLLAIGEPLPELNVYKEGVQNRWLLGDLDRLYLVLRNRSGNYNNRKKYREIVDFLKFFRANSHYDVNQLDDFKPFLFELKKYIYDLIS